MEHYQVQRVLQNGVHGEVLLVTDLDYGDDEKLVSAAFPMPP
jgi:hypothetical protein